MNEDMPLKLEIFVEKLLLAKAEQSENFFNIRRNIEYRRRHTSDDGTIQKKYDSRQIDVEYQQLKGSRLYSAMIEVKFSGNGNVSDKLREIRLREGQKIKKVETPCDQAYEAMLFCGYDHAKLATNTQFSPKIMAQAEKRGVSILDGEALFSIYQNLGFKERDLMTAISSIDVNKLNNWKRTDYL